MEVYDFKTYEISRAYETALRNKKYEHAKKLRSKIAWQHAKSDGELVQILQTNLNSFTSRQIEREPFDSLDSNNPYHLAYAFKIVEELGSWMTDSLPYYDKNGLPVLVDKRPDLPFDRNLIANSLDLVADNIDYYDGLFRGIAKHDYLQALNSTRNLFRITAPAFPDKIDLRDHLIPTTDFSQDEKNTLLHRDKSYFAFSYGTFEDIQIFCIRNSIPFKIYDRWDAGGSSGYVFQVIDENGKNAIQTAFDLSDDKFGRYEVISPGYAFMLLYTNCDSDFKIPFNPRQIEQNTAFFCRDGLELGAPCKSQCEDCKELDNSDE